MNVFISRTSSAIAKREHSTLYIPRLIIENGVRIRLIAELFLC